MDREKEQQKNPTKNPRELESSQTHRLFHEKIKVDNLRPYDHCTLGTEVHYTVENTLCLSAAVENHYLIKSVEKEGLRKVNFANICTGLKCLLYPPSILL